MLVAVVLSVFARPVLAAGPPLSLELSGDAAIVSNATPDGEGVLLGQESRNEDGTAVYRTVTRTWTADADGYARIPIDRTAADSFWMVIEFSTGRHEYVSLGAPVAQKGLPPGLLVATRPNRDRLRVEARYVEAILIRPGVGAWHGRAGDGGASDKDAVVNGRLEVETEGLQSFGSSPQLESVQRGDVLVIFQTHRRTLFIGEVAE